MMCVCVAFMLQLPTPEWGAFANRSVYLAAIAGLMIGCVAALPAAMPDGGLPSGCLASARFRPKLTRSLQKFSLNLLPKFSTPAPSLLVWDEPGEGASQSRLAVGSAGSLDPRGPRSDLRTRWSFRVSREELRSSDTSGDHRRAGNGRLLVWRRLAGSGRAGRSMLLFSGVSRCAPSSPGHSMGNWSGAEAFCLDGSMELSTLPFGVLVARRMAVSRLDGLCLLKLTCVTRRRSKNAYGWRVARDR